VAKRETLEEAYRIAKQNGGAPGIDGQTVEDIEAAGRDQLLAARREALLSDRYQPQPNRRVETPKDNGKIRLLSIPGIRDRGVQGALKLILEAIFEADFARTRTGFDPNGHRTAPWRKPGAGCGGA
jgi:retron-type reverse transcriptase